MKEENMNIFITGGTGLLGHYLIDCAPDIYNVSCSFFPEDKKQVIPERCTAHQLDIRCEAAVVDTIRKIRPDYVIHTASIASVDYVEKNKDEARQTNMGGTLNIIKACGESGAKLVYTSSNAVFDGKTPPYSETDPVNPINYYGELKVREEEAVKKSGLMYAIVRPILMYGWNIAGERKNPATWLIDMLKNGIEIKMVDDIFSNPLYAEDCANAIWKILHSGKSDLYHVGGKDEVSRYDLACAVADTFALDKGMISRVKNSFFDSIAPRPQNTTYDISKLKEELEIFPSGIHEGLMRMKTEKYEKS